MGHVIGQAGPLEPLATAQDVHGTIGGVLFALPVVALLGPITFAFITSYHVAYYDARMGNLPAGA